MQWGSSWKSLIDQAKEEVEILEYQHPKKFESLKQDLRDFISELEAQNQPTINSIYADTQESSSNMNKKRKKVDCVCVGSSMKRRRSKTDAVLERAQQCLRKIRHLKTSLLS